MTIKRRTTTKRTPRRASDIHVAPRILSSEEKRELILAHAEARHPADPVQRMSMWAGVAVCIVFVVLAWFSTVGSGIRASLAGPTDPAVQTVMDAGKQVVDVTAYTNSQLQDRLEEVTAKLQTVSAEQAIVDELTARLANATGTSATSTRPDLFRPAPPTPVATSSKKTNP
jgi:hypothetical protein